MAIVVIINGLVGRTPLNGSTHSNILWYPNVLEKTTAIYLFNLKKYVFH